MARTIRFSFKRFIFHNKISFLLIILILTIILFFPQQTKDSRAHIENLLQTFYDRPPYSEAELDNLYKLRLGLTSSNVTNNECENVWMIAAIPGNHIEDYLWEYLSLLAIRQVYGENEGRKINTFLSSRSIQQIERIFERINFTDLGSVPERCYRLHKAILVENRDNIYFDEDLQTKSLFLLPEGERRYKEIVKSDITNYRQYFRLNRRFEEMALLEIFNLKVQIEILDEVPIVGMYIRTLELPSTYYERAMEFLRKIHYSPIFLVICPSDLLQNCRNTFSKADTGVLKQHNMELELAIMSMCNHTIVENEFGILTSFLNQYEGDTIVYSGIDSEKKWFADYMTENFENCGRRGLLFIVFPSPVERTKIFTDLVFSSKHSGRKDVRISRSRKGAKYEHFFPSR